MNFLALIAQRRFRFCESISFFFSSLSSVCVAQTHWSSAVSSLSPSVRVSERRSLRFYRLTLHGSF